MPLLFWLMDSLNQRYAIDRVTSTASEKSGSVMTKNYQLYYSFHPLIAQVYSSVHHWIQSTPNFQGYEKINYYNECNDESQPFQSAAFQYSRFFPAHYFKVIHTLDKIITPENLLKGLGRNPHICLVDIGCGAGTASLAFLETIFLLKEQNKLKHKVEIYFLAIDANPATLWIYDELMRQIKKKIDCSQINLKYQIFLCPIKEVFSTSRIHLQQVREEWTLPVLPLVFMMHSTVVDLLNTQHKHSLHKHEKLIQLGINPERIATYNSSYSIEYALAYRLLLEEVPIDKLCLFTIGTKSDTKPVQEMSDALAQNFADKHETSRFCDPSMLHHLLYTNPLGSYWREEKKIIYYYSKFCVDVTTIINSNFKEDQDWHDVTSLENLEAAWVCARKYLLNESLCDEVEIRLFETNRGESLSRLQSFLSAYIKDFLSPDDYIDYSVPKNSSQARTKGLSRMEEEILSVAIFHKLGAEITDLRGSSYAFRLRTEDGDRQTEELYENWFAAYKKFINQASLAVKQNINSVVIHADIKAFYNKIIQDKLSDLVSKKITESLRIRWLIKLLISKNLNEHEVGLGITQGHIGSGFYANIYLTSIDIAFGLSKEGKVKFFRYVDDMIFVIPEQKDVNDILEELEQKLEELGLELNKEKTETYSGRDFLEFYSENDELTNLANEFQEIVNPLWSLNLDYQKVFKLADRKDDDKRWWELVEQYQSCLQSIGIYIQATDLSRRIDYHIFNQNKYRKNFNGTPELNLTELPTDDRGLKQWAAYFEKNNLNWKNYKDSLKAKLVNMFCESWQKLQCLSPTEVRKFRELQTRIRFSLNKLYLLGLAEISNDLAIILCQHPAIVREPLQALESLARQGCSSKVVGILNYYQNNSGGSLTSGILNYYQNNSGSLTSMNEYMRAVTLRLFRFLPKINEIIWKKIVEFATLGSLVERLMATETWIYLGKSLRISYSKVTLMLCYLLYMAKRH